jgi:hypothetical protein
MTHLGTMKSGHRGFFLTLLPDKKKTGRIKNVVKLGLYLFFRIQTKLPTDLRQQKIKSKSVMMPSFRKYVATNLVVKYILTVFCWRKMCNYCVNLLTYDAQLVT